MKNQQPSPGLPQNHHPIRMRSDKGPESYAAGRSFAPNVGGWDGWQGMMGYTRKKNSLLERTEKSEIIITVKRKPPSNAGNQNMNILHRI